MAAVSPKCGNPANQLAMIASIMGTSTALGER
jgi:hypothetical protein